ncbi:12357_t:CDS:2 [Cetraspora pellucida]|uniref:12357_t:CDS:1 n=1 Tax=Cetraspora pellucida TaxID=1433469 RepID=A0A9N8Z487_9GLOM|nr:12357_t:CDS:2 [Cetraspora pellucida]
MSSLNANQKKERNIQQLRVNFESKEEKEKKSISKALVTTSR